MNKKVLIIINTEKEESKKLAQKISVFLQDRNFTVEYFDFDGFRENKIFSDYEFVVTLGGDGTVLYAARNCVENEIPVFPVNLGKFGFMAPVQQDDWELNLENFLNGKAPFQNRSLVKATLIRENKSVSENLAMNDIVINTTSASGTAALVVKYNDVLLCRLVSDGVIISTPTGSTAYSASAGGPIVDPLLDAFVMTPLNAFSLSSRPIVLNTDGILEIEINPCRVKDISMTVDGQPSIQLQVGDRVRIQRIEKKVKLIGCTEEKFYNSLRSKLNWRGEPYA